MKNQFRSWTEGLDALRERAEEVRGTVEDGDAAWPKTTNGDVLTIAAVIDPSLKARRLRAELAQRWQSVRDDVLLAALAPHKATYAKSQEFWSTVAEICEYLDEAPVPDLWGVLADHLGGAELRNSGPSDDGGIARFDGIKTYDEMWRAQRDFLAQKRGFDVPPPPPGMGIPGLKIPRSTNQDVLQIATYWSKELASAKHVMGYDGAVAKWQAALADVDHYAKTGKPDDVYAKNSEFWRVASDVSIQIAVGDEAPSKFDLFVGALKYSITHLPDTLSDAAGKGVDLLADAGHAVGHVANEIGKGLFGGLGTPLLVGGGLLGVYLLTRDKHEHAEA